MGCLLEDGTRCALDICSVVARVQEIPAGQFLKLLRGLC